LALSFCLIHLAPGDPVIALGGEHGDAGHYAAIRARFGLDRPLPEQFVTYASRVVRGDLGVSYVHGRPAASVIMERLPATLLLMSTALALSTVGGTALGLFSARRNHRLSDLLCRSAAVLGYATPTFWLAQIAVLTVAMPTGWFPVQGMTDARRSS